MQWIDIMKEHPLKIFEKIDPALLQHVQESSDFAFADGAIPRKYKLLIGMAFDASYGAVNGVKSLAQQAMEAGATKEEIVEALRVAQHLSGVGCVYVGARTEGVVWVIFNTKFCR
jgi:alkylhydroperoxidase/carboxymuconolactone decarboxylase family protein YurZ